MQQELSALKTTIPFPKPSSGNLAYTTFSPCLSTLKHSTILNIAHINATAFYMQSCRQNNISFFTSLYEIDCIINEKEDLDDDVMLEEIKAKVPV